MEVTSSCRLGSSNIRFARLSLHQEKVETTGDSGTKLDYQNVESGDGNYVADWRQLFAVSSNQTLKFYPPQRLNGKVIVAPP